MIKSIKLAAAATLLLAAVPFAAEALPLAPAPAAPAVVTPVAGGCGIGFHRGPLGGCRPNGVVLRPVVRRPVICRTVLLPLPHRVCR